MTKTDIATLRRIHALLQSDDPECLAVAGYLVTRLLVRWDKAYRGTKGDTR